jgi:hypothetical protein
MAVAQAGGLNITHTVSPDMEGLKPELPFGQVKLSAYLILFSVYVLYIRCKIIHYLSYFFLATLFSGW